jgi:hypothetical protein
VGRKRFEVSTTGLDEGLQGISSGPFPASGFSTYTGLRVPAVLSAASTPATQPRYWFNLCSRRFTGKTRIVGVRQMLTIGVDANGGTPPEYPLEMFVRTPAFRFSDGNVSWHLVIDRSPDISAQLPMTDTQNWAFLKSDSPAMLYQTFTNSNVNPITGAPVIYSLGLTAYTPPATAPNWDPIGGIGNFYDLRCPWDSPISWENLNFEVEGSGRIMLLATVLQTNPATRDTPTNQVTTLSAFATPEEAFIKDLTFTGAGEAPFAPIYWRIAGALAFEDEEGAQ